MRNGGKNHLEKLKTFLYNTIIILQKGELLCHLLIKQTELVPA